jgi:thiamine biosynthesis lipoprotein ApbE
MSNGQRWLIRIFAAGLLCILAWSLTRPEGGGGGSAYFTGEAFATKYHVTYASGPDPVIVKQAVDAELARIDAMASTWRDDSELMRYNRAEDAQAFSLSPQLAWLIEQAEAIEAQTGGAFSLRPDGGAIDLSGIAKGYAVDRVVELLRREYGITNCLVDIGGEVRAVGDRPKSTGWRVGIYLPTDAAGIQAPVLQLSDMSVATSGAYFKGDHILDPSTGKPVDHDLLSVSVVHPSNTTADALATALYVMGADRGVAWAKQHGIRAIFILKDGSQIRTDAAE